MVVGGATFGGFQVVPSEADAARKDRHTCILICIGMQMTHEEGHIAPQLGCGALRACAEDR